MSMALESTSLGNFLEIYEEHLEENNFQSLKLLNISKKYRTKLALKDMSFELKKGDVFGYIGPNGAGKTTTIKIIVGLIKDYSGKYLINDELIKKNISKFVKLLGYHPQDTGFQAWRTVNHALYTFGRLSGIDKAILSDRIQSILHFVRLFDLRHKKIKHLSSGMVQKLRLAQALLNLPKILILDEPLSGLDPASRYQIKSLIKSLAQRQITILFSSHILNDVEDIANRIGILNHGQIMKIGTPTELQEQFQIGNIIEIIYAENSNPCKALESIKAIDKIEFDQKSNQLLYLRPDEDLDLAAHQILGSILQQKCSIRSFRFLKPSLESVYLKYVSGDKK
ncbi:MAG: ABC transporter ATP-binding protein [Promethearchaeota archaeon]|nr:MAG: ABC transporter ATP-binding protein [Candidatus Lokiarchaeota archaeon]